MLNETLTPRDVRQVIADFMSLPETEFMVVAEVIADLKQQAQAKADRRAQATALVARARQRTAELQRLPHTELIAQFHASLETLRAEALTNGTVTDDEAEWVNDD